MASPCDPIFLTPRLLPRHWGRENFGEWFAGHPMPNARIGEVWSADGATVSESGEHLDTVIRSNPRAMLGELGRAPPTVRLLLSAGRTDPIAHDGHFALWRALEGQLDGGISATTPDGRTRRLPWRCGDLLRVNGSAAICIENATVAVEVRPAFSPSNNARQRQSVQRLLGPRERSARQTSMRDLALSVEVWTLPDTSIIQPDGETCHVLTALTRGVKLNGRVLSRGQSVFVPSHGDAAALDGGGAQVMVSYPDLVPTEIWRQMPHSDPPSAALGQARALVPLVDTGQASAGGALAA